MSVRKEKMKKLAEIARLYYEQDQTQSQIAKAYGVSRPLVSRMLKEAKEYGIVTVHIAAPGEGESLILNQAKNLFGIQGGALIPQENSDYMTNQALADAAFRYITGLGGRNLGLGWGTIVGEMVSLLEKAPPQRMGFRTVSPLVGNSNVSNRNYHSNESVRIVAQQTMAEPVYLYAPAFAGTLQERQLIEQMESFRQVYGKWEKIDVALVNIGNYPSTPDFASVARYGRLLSEKHAVGRLLAYYFNRQGEIIRSDTDYAIQIPTQLLGRCKHVVGVCSANVRPQTLAGALRTGLIHHIIATESSLRAAAECRED